MIYVFLGIQGSGKGTQAEMLCEEKGFVHVNLGELFRSHIKNGTAIGLSASEYIAKGQLVPDSVVFQVIEEALNQLGKSMVIDGFPRTIHQAEYLTSKYKIDKVIYLDLSDDRAKERMHARKSCSYCKKSYNLLYNPPHKAGICDECHHALVSRADDTEELIQQRIDLFHSETSPLTDYFEKMGILLKINAFGEIEEIHKRIVDSL